MLAIELIEKEYRHKRFLSLTTLREELSREKGRCTWCDKKCYRRWCSEACREEGYVRAGFIKGPIERRDRGVCAICGVDTLAIKSRVKRLWDKAKGRWDPRTGYTRRYPHSFSRLQKYARKTGYYPSATPYEIDHIVPVVEGGGCCGLDNLRTLCFTCHRQETKELARRRAASKRDANRPLLSGIDR